MIFAPLLYGSQARGESGFASAIISQLGMVYGQVFLSLGHGAKPIFNEVKNNQTEKERTHFVALTPISVCG